MTKANRMQNVTENNVGYKANRFLSKVGNILMSRTGLENKQSKEI